MLIYYHTILLYNTSHILIFIFLPLYLNIIFLIFLYSLFTHSLSLSLSLSHLYQMVYNRKMCQIDTFLSKNYPYHTSQNCANIYYWCSTCKFTMILFILHLFFILFLYIYPKNEEREWMSVVVVCEERKILLKKLRKFDILIKCILRCLK